jgi:serpin B
MVLRLRICTILAALTSATACGAVTEPGPSGAAPAPAPVVEALPRALTVGEQKLIVAANEFAFSLFAQLSAAQRDSNVFVSPLGASMALGMTMNGAANTTYAQIRNALALGAASDMEINDSYKSLIALLRGIDPTIDLRIGSSLWYREGVPFNEGFVDAGRDSFDAEVSALDFASPGAVQTINSWASSATQGRIPTIIDAIDANQMMFLMNASYFKGTWRTRFDPDETRDGPFRSASGEQVVKQMHRVGFMRYFVSPNFEAVDLPYGNNAFSMTLVLPRAGKSMEGTIALLQVGDGWSQLAGALRDLPMHLYLPRFTVEWERTLNDDLKALGVRDAFSPSVSDFTRMSSGRELYLSVVKQRTVFEVNEEGAAPTTVFAPGYEPIPVVMRVERPFLFLIRDRLSGTIIFVGKIVRLP